MPTYTLAFSNIDTGGTADAYKTIAALIASATAGYKARLRRLVVTPADDSPADANINVRINRIDDVSAGGAGTATAVTAANMGRPLSDQRDGVITGARNYTAEPTAYNTEPLWQASFNSRGGLTYEWGIDDAPVINNDQLLGLLASPTASAARTLSGCMTFEEI